MEVGTVLPLGDAVNCWRLACWRLALSEADDLAVAVATTTLPLATAGEDVTGESGDG